MIGKYENIKIFINKNKKKFEDVFETKIELFRNNPEDLYSEFMIPNSNLMVELNNPYSGVTETVTLYESIHTIYKIIKRLKHFSSKLEYEFQQNFVIGTIEDYKHLLKNLRYLLYSNFCNNLFKLDSMKEKIVSIKWDPKDEEADTILFMDCNGYVDDIFKEIKEKFDKIVQNSSNMLTKRAKKRVFEVILEYFKNFMLDCYGKVKKVKTKLTIVFILGAKCNAKRY